MHHPYTMLGVSAPSNDTGFGYRSSGGLAFSSVAKAVTT